MSEDVRNGRHIDLDLKKLNIKNKKDEKIGCGEMEERYTDWLQSLIDKGSKISHDAGYFSKDMQIEINEDLVMRGREFFNNNFFMTLVNMFIGLYTILYIPNIARILNITEKSGNTELAFTRYLSTLNHAIKWFQGSDDMKKSLKQVLSLHKAGSLKGQKEALSRTGEQLTEHGITQYDMVITQWGFIGPSIVFNDKIPFYQKDVSCDGFLHVMYLVGKSLGILDEFNLCQGSVLEIETRCKLLHKEVLQPVLRENDETSQKMSFHLLNGINVLNPLIIQKDFKLFCDNLLLEEDFNIDNSSLVYRGYILFFQKILHVPGYSLLRIFTNNLLKYNIWLAGQWYLFIYEAIKAQQSKPLSPYQRFCQIMNIPIFTCISVSSLLATKVKTSIQSNSSSACLCLVATLALLTFHHNY